VLASDGSEAFLSLATHPDIGLVILDLMLPGMRGAEVLARMRSDEAWRAIPCLILTAAGQDAQVQEAEALGVSAVMTKPFSLRRLFERVVTLTGAVPSPAERPTRAPHDDPPTSS